MRPRANCRRRGRGAGQRLRWPASNGGLVPPTKLDGGRTTPRAIKRPERRRTERSGDGASGGAAARDRRGSRSAERGATKPHAHWGRGVAAGSVSDLGGYLIELTKGLSASPFRSVPANYHGARSNHTMLHSTRSDTTRYSIKISPRLRGLTVISNYSRERRCDTEIMPSFCVYRSVLR